MENNGVEKKSFNFFGLLLVVLIAAGCAFGGYFVGVNATKDEIKETEKDEITDEKEESNEEKAPEKNSKYSFVKEYKNTYTVNGKDIDLISYFYQDKETINMSASTDGNVDAYIIRMDLFVNGSKIIDTESIHANVDKTVSDNFVSSDPVFNISVFKDSSNGSDYYLLNLGDYEIVRNLYSEKYIYLFNYEGKLLNAFKHWNDSGVVGIFGTQDMIGDRTAVLADGKPGMYKLYTHSLIDVHENFIYAIEKGATCDSAIEYRYTVENGKLLSTHSRTYTFDYIEGAGQC